MRRPAICAVRCNHRHRWVADAGPPAADILKIALTAEGNAFPRIRAAASSLFFTPSRLFPPLTAQNSACHRVELFQKFWIARFWRRDQGVVERTIGSDWARLVLAGKIAGKPCHQTFSFLGV